MQVIRLLEETCVAALQTDHALNSDAAKRRLNGELDYYRRLCLEQHSLRNVFRRYCVSLANRRNVMNLVFGASNERAAVQLAYASILCGYNPAKITRHYSGRSDKLLRRMIKARGLSRPQAHRHLTNNRSQFRLYAKGVLAGAEYFGRYKNGRCFAKFVQQWLSDPDITAMLPEYFQALDLPGFGAALAADFLKELGVQELGKPDIWVKRCLHAAGWTAAKPSAFAVQRLLWAIWRKAGSNYPPIIVDKLMYLVGSGKYAMVEPQYRCRSRFKEFTKAIY